MHHMYGNVNYRKHVNNFVVVNLRTSMKSCIGGTAWPDSETAQCACDWTGLMLQEACIIANKMGHLQFRASNGWLDSFKTYTPVRTFTS